MPQGSPNSKKPRAPDPFLVLYPFMWKDLGLKGVELLVFARVFGFCKRGGSFYESRARTAKYLGVSERSVTRAMGTLVEGNLIIDVDPLSSLDGVSTRTYLLSDWVIEVTRSCDPDNLSPPDNLTGDEEETGDEMSHEGVPGWHLKSKSESKFD